MWVRATTFVQDLLLFYRLNYQAKRISVFSKGNTNYADENYDLDRHFFPSVYLGISARLLVSFPSPLQSLAKAPNKGKNKTMK